VQYSLKIGAILLVSFTTDGTCIFVSTQSTDTLYTEELEVDDRDAEISDSVTNWLSQKVGKPVQCAVSTLEVEISELDIIGFDETLLLHQSVDI
jgi:hypothetical protein